MTSTWRRSRALRAAIESKIERVQDMGDLGCIARAAQERTKALAAEILKPGTEEPINEFTDGLYALDYIWDLRGDSVFGSGRPNKHRAIDYYLGRKVEHLWGEGVIVRMTPEKVYPAKYGIKIELPCHVDDCESTSTRYAKPGCHSGAFCYLYDEDSKNMIDLRNQVFCCGECDCHYHGGKG